MPMRDFNILGYVCKFINKYLEYCGHDTGGNGMNGGNGGRLRGVEILLMFFRQLTPEGLVGLN